MKGLKIEIFPVFKPDQEFLAGVCDINNTLPVPATFKEKANVNFGAYLDRKLVGFSQATSEYNIANNRLISLYVNKQVKDKFAQEKLRIGTKLLRHTEAVLSLFSHTVRLTSTTNAKSFYDRNGYKPEYDDEYFVECGDWVKQLDIHNIHSKTSTYPLFCWGSKSSERLGDIVSPFCDRSEDLHDICQSVEYSINKEKNPAWGAYDNGRLIGVISGDVQKKLAAATICNLYVDQKAHGRGIGQSLLNEFIRFCAHSDIKKVNVTSQFDAAGFYRKNGFISIYRDCDGLMQKTL